MKKLYLLYFDKAKRAAFNLYTYGKISVASHFTNVTNVSHDSPAKQTLVIQVKILEEILAKNIDNI